MLECKFCGYKNSDGSVYCGCCGKPLNFETELREQLRWINNDD